jgi:DNA-binding response OmpR family regulator
MKNRKNHDIIYLSEKIQEATSLIKSSLKELEKHEIISDASALADINRQAEQFLTTLSSLTDKIHQHTLSSKTTRNNSIEQIDSASPKEVLILIEDDDNMKKILTNALSAKYQIITSADGHQVIELAQRINPDIIISDIMLPNMRGDEICRQLKSSIDTSHIPIILISALDEKENIIMGLEAGADDYIIKPFEIAVLKARLRNILKNREKLRQMILSTDSESEDIDYTNDLDKEFLLKAKHIVNKEITNPDFSINDFCRALGMSRTSTYNKLKTLTNQGPNDFIRIIRLNMAKELLKTKKYTITDVAFMVGFSDPKYFSTCFKKQFDLSPSKINK